MPELVQIGYTLIIDLAARMQPTWYRQVKLPSQIFVYLDRHVAGKAGLSVYG